MFKELIGAQLGPSVAKVVAMAVCSDSGRGRSSGSGNENYKRASLALNVSYLKTTLIWYSD